MAKSAQRLALLFLVTTGLFGLDLSLGSVHIPPSELASFLLGAETSDPGWNTVVKHFRLPKAITALLTGAALAVSGLLMQTLFRNPLAGPYVLGISAGASLGVAIVTLSTGSAAVLLGGLGVLGDAKVVIAASLGSGMVLFLVLIAARRVSSLTLLILGVLFGYATSALVTILMHFSLSERIQAYVQWTFGSFAGVTWGQLQVLAPALVLGGVLAMAAAKPLNALLLGDGHARSLGMSVMPARILILLSTALLAGGTTAFCGPIGFLGVAVPHLARGIFQTSDHRLLLPATALCGSAIALFADLVSQLPGREEILPLNAVTALLGAPVIAGLILRRRTLDASFS